MRVWIWISRIFLKRDDFLERKVRNGEKNIRGSKLEHTGK